MSVAASARIGEVLTAHDDSVKTASDENGIKNATKDGEPWTTILVDLREQAPMPEIGRAHV